MIYYYRDVNDRCYMLGIYAKNEQADLTPEQRRTLKAYIQKHLK